MISDFSSSTPLPEDLKNLAQIWGRLGVERDQVVDSVAQVTELADSRRPLLELKTKAALPEPGRFERMALWTAAQHSAARLPDVPVPTHVRRAWLLECQWMTGSAAAKVLDLQTPGFEAAAKTATLRRFPAGPMDWEVSGIPRSWLTKTERPFEAARLAAFVASRLGGFQPMFFLHMGRKPRNRLLILEEEVLKMYQDVVQALEMQPEIRGVMAYGWFHDPAAVADNPHLAWLNRPYRESGGLLVNLGPAGEDSGVTAGNAQRRALLESGQLTYRLGLALWPRNAALAWARGQPDLLRRP